MTCPSELELARSLSVGADPALTSHLADCATCRDAWDATRSTIDLARELPVDVPPHAHREELRTALLARNAAAPARSRSPIGRWITVLGTLAAAGLVVYLVARSPASDRAPVTARGTVHPHPGARFELASPTPDEIVRLHDGTIEVEVDPLAAHERFRVVVGANEVEVHGTSFEVTAAGDHLIAVRVTHGRVEVRPIDGAPAVLGAGQSWHTTLASAKPPSLPSPPPAIASAPAAPMTASASRHVAVVHATPVDPPPTAIAPPRSEHVRAPEEIAYDEAWDAMRANKFHQSAAAFARTIAFAPDGALADDARYWHAVSLAREPRVVEAIAAFRELLDEHTGGAQRGDAAVMLGWLLIDAHEPTEAGTRFRAAVSDPSPTVRDSAAAGLRALHASR